MVALSIVVGFLGYVGVNGSLHFVGARAEHHVALEEGL